jgi:hypothetical protein
MLPAGTPIRFYPDITHTINCQYPVPQWGSRFPGHAESRTD